LSSLRPGPPRCGVTIHVVIDIIHVLESRWKAQQPTSQAPGATDREQLNLWFLTDTGLDALREALRAGTYQVGLPEDAVLPTVARRLGGTPRAVARGL
jgi:hypothetical protein